MLKDPQVTKLGLICDFTNGGAWGQDEYADEGIRVVRVTDIKDGTVDFSSCKFLPQEAIKKYSKHLLKYNDLVICTVGSHPTQPGSVVGRTAIIPQYAQGSLLNQNAVLLRASTPQLDQKWLGYFGKSKAFHDYIISCARGSANQVRMAIGLLKEMDVLLPPLSNQRKIAAILSAYDDLIENNTRRIAILEEMARLIYREWFVHFRFPEYEKARFVDSEMGKLPKGWVVQTMSSICKLISRGVTPKYESGSKRFIINQKVNRGLTLAIEELKELDSSTYVPPEKYATFGDILVNCLGEGTIGRVHFYKEIHKEWAVDQHMSICRPTDLSLGLVAYFALDSTEGQSKIASLKTGGTNMTMFNISALRNFEIVVPEEKLRKEFEKYCLPII